MYSESTNMYHPNGLFVTMYYSVNLHSTGMSPFVETGGRGAVAAGASYPIHLTQGREGCVGTRGGGGGRWGASCLSSSCGKCRTPDQDKRKAPTASTPRPLVPTPHPYGFPNDMRNTSRCQSLRQISHAKRIAVLNAHMRPIKQLEEYIRYLHLSQRTAKCLRP